MRVCAFPSAPTTRDEGDFGVPQRFCASCCFEASTRADAPSSTLFWLPELTAVFFRKNSKAIWLATPAARGRQKLKRARSLERPHRLGNHRFGQRIIIKRKPWQTSEHTRFFGVACTAASLGTAIQKRRDVCFPFCLFSLRPLDWFHSLGEPLLGRGPPTSLGSQAPFCRLFSANQHSGSGHLRQRLAQI